MTRSQLITKISQNTGLQEAQVELVMDDMVENVINTLKQGEKVTIAGFGRFEMRTRKTKSFTNPKTKVSSQLEPTVIPGFKASGIFKSRLGCKE